MPAIHEDLVPILDAISVLSPAAFRFQNETIPVAPGPVQPLPGLPNHPLPPTPLARDLQSVLYTRCYSHRIDQPQPVTQATPSLTPDPAFIASLSRSNRTQSRWEAGWSVYAVNQGGQVSLQKGDRQRFAVPGEFLSHGPPGVPPQPGVTVSVFIPRESTAAQPGFYFAYSEILSDVWDEHNLLRFYFHSPSEIAPDLLDYLTAALNRRLIPFRLKALSDPAAYTRTDAVVLYLAKRYYDITVRLIRDMPAAVSGRLRSATPLFTCPIQPGVGIAEDPNTGESFGMSRCRMLAEGIVNASRQGHTLPQAAIQSVAERFAQEGFNLDLPHLNPGSQPLPDVAREIDFAYA